MSREFEAERGRLRVDAVAASNRHRHLVLEGTPLQRGQELVDIPEQNVARLLKLHGKAGVEYVARGHALMREARFGSHMLGEAGEEGDHVVLDLALDLVDARDVEAAPGADRRGGGFRDRP